jgi:hypothetical protein
MMLYNRTPLKPAAVQPRKIVLYLELGDFPGRSIPKPLLGLEELHLASARSGAGSCNSPASKRAILTGPTGTSFHQANSSGGKARWPAIGANRAPVCQPLMSDGLSMWHFSHRESRHPAWRCIGL